MRVIPALVSLVTQLLLVLRGIVPLHRLLVPLGSIIVISILRGSVLVAVIVSFEIRGVKLVGIGRLRLSLVHIRTATDPHALDDVQL